MSEARFTPGPWAVCSANESVYETGVGQADGWTVCDICDDFEGDHEANAHLIAAAPEMYEMLDMLLDSSNIEDCYHAIKESREEIKALLAKARGEA